MTQALVPVFAALGDETRWSILAALGEGDASASALAGRLPVTRQAIAKHLAVLQRAGLVAVEEAGRERRFSASTAPMTDAGRWLTTTGAAWDDRLGRLAARLEHRARDGRPAHGGD